MENKIKLSSKSKKKIRQAGKFSKMILRSCLVAVFFILISLFGLFAICWIDSFYNSSRGVSKNPLLGAYVVVTESMIPTIKVNDAIVVKRVKDNTLNIGDIITFSSNDTRYNGLTITHRIVGKQLGDDGNYLYRTKGDNNVLEDTAIVNLSSIYGKVIFKLPKIGYACRFVMSPFGLIVSVVSPVLLVVLYEGYRIYKTLRRRYNEVEIL